jgi:purine-binding chemotaxis protein CheW
MPEQTNPRQLVVFTLGAEHYALPIQQVHEIIRYSEPRSVASRADWVRGVISLRGRIVPVYDLAARLGARSEVSEQTKIVIVEAGSETAGVIVDGVEEVLTVSDDQIEEVPSADSALIECIAKVGDRLIVLLKGSMIFASAEYAAA